MSKYERIAGMEEIFKDAHRMHLRARACGKIWLEGVLDRYIGEALKNEEKIIKETLKSLLKREPTLDDYKKCTKVFKEGEVDKYHLLYENVVIGSMHYSVSKITFEPSEVYK